MPNVVIGGNIIGAPGAGYSVTVILNNNLGAPIGNPLPTGVTIGEDSTGNWMIGTDLTPAQIEELKSATIRIRGPEGFREYHVKFVSNPFKTLSHTISLLSESVCRKRAGFLTTDFVGKFAWGGTYVAASGRLLSANGFPLAETATDMNLQ